MKNIKIIEVPSEIGAGTRGASLGVEAIKIAALDFMSATAWNSSRTSFPSRLVRRLRGQRTSSDTRRCG